MKKALHEDFMMKSEYVVGKVEKLENFILKSFERLMECTLFIAHQAYPFGYIFVTKPSQRSSSGCIYQKGLKIHRETTTWI